VVKVGSLTGICPDDEIVSTTKENVDGFITDFVFGWLQANKKK
jgi:hypothetical protein